MTLNSRTSGSKTPISSFKRRFLIRLTAVMIGGMLLDGYIMGIIGAAGPRISEVLDLGAAEYGLIGAASLVGILVGSPIGGWLGDRFGRKPLFMIDMGLFVGASVLQFFVHDFAFLVIIRFIMGIAIGVEYSVGWPLMSEFSPAKLRGRLMGLGLVAFYTGFMVAFLVGYLLVTYTGLSWQVILGSSTVLAVILFIARLGLPESPRWLWSKGRREEAIRVANKYLDDEGVHDMQRSDAPEKQGNFGMLFSRQNWRATVFTSVFWLCAVTPYFALATFAATVLEGYGLSDGLASGVLLNALATAGVIATVLLIDKLGRRMLTVPPQWLCLVLLLVLGVWSGAPSWVVLTCFLAYMFFNAGYNTLTGVYPGELFPTEIRGLGTGFATMVSRFGAAAGTFLMPVSIEAFGPNVTILFAAALTFVGALVSQWLAPETKGMNLTDTGAILTH
ncbi:MFS transporter [Gulosibacter sp. 10]|uniref:MFS transporter n=1 Tax=Gulosibacter sp. 10 TaxID=1255570 RepID=UPI000B35262D|nr:MFS transporter [Gulosibacter sp. 10]